VSWVYVEAEDTARLAGDDGDIPGLIAKPSLDHIVVGGGIPEPVRHQLPYRVLGGGVAIGPATGTGHPVLMPNRVMQWQDGKAEPGILHRKIEDSMSQD
jgi:hypothetical protein